MIGAVCSSLATILRYVTGTTVIVDGGYVAR